MEITTRQAEDANRQGRQDGQKWADNDNRLQAMGKNPTMTAERLSTIADRVASYVGPENEERRIAWTHIYAIALIGAYRRIRGAEYTDSAIDIAEALAKEYAQPQPEPLATVMTRDGLQYMLPGEHPAPVQKGDAQQQRMF